MSEFDLNNSTLGHARRPVHMICLPIIIPNAVLSSATLPLTIPHVPQDSTASTAGMCGEAGRKQDKELLPVAT